MNQFFHPTQTIDYSWKEIVKNTKHGLVIGCGNKYFNDKFVYTDCVKTNITDYVMDAHRLKFKNNMFDTVLCIGVLEHTKNPHKVVDEIYRVLKSNGIVYVTVPFMQPYHSSPTDYWRFTKDGLRELFKDFKIIKIGACCGSVSALAWLTTRFWRNILPKKINSLSSGLMIFFKPFQLVEKKINSDDMASAYFIIARKI